MTIWEQLVRDKARYIGGILLDQDDDPIAGAKGMAEPARTVITDITYQPYESVHSRDLGAMFTVHGQDFSCGCATAYLGVEPRPKQLTDGITLLGYGGHRWEFAPNVAHLEKNNNAN